LYFTSEIENFRAMEIRNVTGGCTPRSAGKESGKDRMGMESRQEIGENEREG
jgi:hypothetical protein